MKENSPAETNFLTQLDKQLSPVLSSCGELAKLYVYLRDWGKLDNIIEFAKVVGTRTPPVRTAADDLCYRND